MKHKLTQEILKELVSYDPETGIFTCIKTRCRTKKGNIIGTIDSKGYVKAGILGKVYFCHRLAFLYMEGYFPEQTVDHINGIRTDNRWENLRHVSRKCNSQNKKLSSNNSSGFYGVSYNKRTNRWCSYIQLEGKQTIIGYFKSPVEAAVARVKYEENCFSWKCNLQKSNREKLLQMGIDINKYKWLNTKDGIQRLIDSERLCLNGNDSETRIRTLQECLQIVKNGGIDGY